MIRTNSIKEVADDFDLSISTIRYYDKKGLLPFVAKNEAGYRIFTDADLNLIKTIVCLKNTGMSIKDIRTYIEYVMDGPETIDQRKALLQRHKRQVLLKQQMLTENLKEIDIKLDRYDSPNATEIVGQQFEYLREEKQQLKL